MSSPGLGLLLRETQGLESGIENIVVHSQRSGHKRRILYTVDTKPGGLSGGFSFCEIGDDDIVIGTAFQVCL